MSGPSQGAGLVGLPTAPVADACLRLGVPLRAAPPGLVPLLPGRAVAGPVRPALHLGSVDAFLEAIAKAQPGDVLVVDNQGREDEACVGDLTAIEAQHAGLAGLVVWGLHRDTDALRTVGLPAWSYGAFPCGPQAIRPRPQDAPPEGRIRFGGVEVGEADAVVADDDGALFVPRDRLAEVARVAAAIVETERRQAETVRAGRSLRQQLRFDEYLSQRARDPALTFRAHLRRLGGAIEE